MLIPFAFSNKLQKLVDVDEVESGLACNCVCPSCNMFLQARKGDKNEHHFSHHEAALNICAYSYWVSIRDMAKQIILEAKFININLTKTLNLHTIPRKLGSSLVEIFCTEKKNNGFDLEITTSIGILNVYFLTPEEHRQKYRLADDYFTHALVLEIDLQRIQNNSRCSKKEQLKKLILDNINSKKLVTTKFAFEPKDENESGDESRFEENIFIKKQNPNSSPKVYDVATIAKVLYLDIRSLTYRQQKAISKMEEFYIFCITKHPKPLFTEMYTVLYEQDGFLYISYDEKFYAIADVDGIYVVYTFDNGMFVKIDSTRNFNYIPERLQKLHDEANTLF